MVMEKQQRGCRRIVGIALPVVAVVIMMAVVFGACRNHVAGPSKRSATAAATVKPETTMSAAEHVKSKSRLWTRDRARQHVLGAIARIGV